MSQPARKGIEERTSTSWEINTRIIAQDIHSSRFWERSSHLRMREMKDEWRKALSEEADNPARCDKSERNLILLQEWDNRF
jgi:hypothetical protein